MRRLGLICMILLCKVSISQDYFQQHVAYTIKVRLDDRRHELSADLTLTYTNNSPDELPFIWFHIWPNAYREANTAMGRQHLENGDFDFYYASAFERGFIDSLDFSSAGQSLKWEYHPDYIDVCKVNLSEPLKPGEKITIHTPFHVKIPNGRFSRLGHIGESYQITQWYPKPAVYDKDGWHEMPYLTQGEFYSEYGSFDVEITLPENYVLGATGDLQNETEKKWLRQKESETRQGIEDGSLFEQPEEGIAKNTFPVSSVKNKTIRFVQDRVHDFAWFADKRFHVLSDTLKLPNSGRIVTCRSLFTDSQLKLWLNSVEYIKDATYYYSLWNGDYPYNHVTAVDGTISAGGGMEYPNITVIGRASSALSLETVIVHEVGHNWFYGILGSNERLHAWMDEGLNTLNENRYLETKYPEKSAIREFIPLNSKLSHKLSLDIFKQKSIHELSYLLSARQNNDQPIELPADQYTSLNYGAIVYSKTGIVFDYLKGYLGEALFDKCMKAYFDKWKFKHPQPADLRTVFEETLERDMSWFFDDILKTTKSLDHKIVWSKATEWGDYDVKIKSKGEINGPFSLGGIRNDTVVVYQWYDSIPESGEVTFPKGNYDRIVLDPFWETPELTRSNNTLRINGLFKRTEPLKLQPVGGIENPYRTTIYWLPMVAWNQHDGFMAGLMFYNSMFPRKRFEYQIAPGYAWGSGTMVGAGMLAYNFRTRHNGIFQNVRGELTGKRFHFSPTAELISYNKLGASLDLELRRARPRHNPKQVFRLAYTHILFGRDSSSTWQFGDLTHNLTLQRPFYRLDLVPLVRYGKDNLQGEMLLTQLSMNHRFYYGEKRRTIDFRLYGAYYPVSDNNNDRSWRSTLSSPSGEYDYTFDDWFLGRSTNYPNLLSQQMVTGGAGFKAFVPVASDQWIASVNTTLQLPVPIHLSVFGDLGMYPVRVWRDGMVSDEARTAYDAGLKLRMFRGILDVYFPLFYADLIADYYDYYKISFPQRIRFELSIKSLNFLKQIGRIGS